MAETKTLMTADELLAMPDDDFQYELVRGELVKMPPAGEDHGSREGEAFYHLKHFARQHELGAVYTGDTGFRLERHPDTVRAPDVSFVSRERLSVQRDRLGYFPGAPDLAVEIASPSQSVGDVMQKVADYLRAGSSLVWAYYPRSGKCSVFRANGSVAELGPDDTLNGEDVLPGFAMKVSELFATS